MWRYERGDSAGVLHNETTAYDARGKVLLVNNGASKFRDPLGHIFMSRTRNPEGSADPTLHMHAYHPNSSALSRKSSVLLWDTISNEHYENSPDTTYNSYDAAGNVIRSGASSWVRESGELGTHYSHRARSAGNSYYGADEKLRYLKRYSWRAGPVNDGTFDEYWYDALGRRVLVRSLREGLCQASPSGCESSIERAVWAGDQILYEIRADGGSAANLDAAPPISHRLYGVVGYTHGGGIDQPLTVIRKYHPAGLTTLVPHANYRGVYRAGTTRSGALHTCHGESGCINVLWPAPRRGAYHQGDATGGDWVGSLIPGMQDASGLLYRRNRYYNPQTGQFTQTDPIGLAGGLNTYGFAAGDPVTYSDPYGLAAQDCERRPWLCTAIEVTATVIGAGTGFVAGGGRARCWQPRQVASLSRPERGKVRRWALRLACP